MKASLFTAFFLFYAATLCASNFLGFSVLAAKLNSQGNLDSLHTEILQLSKDPQWLNLLHYDRNLFFQKSTVTSTSFFLSPFGKRDPHKELLATIKSFHAKAPKNHNAHSQCLFPARLLWINRRLPDAVVGIPKVHCDKYINWSKESEVQSVSLLFATGYLGNPASYYGHTLIRFNKSQKINLLDLSINYGAKIPPNENALAYVLKGLLGGYQASFTYTTANQHNHNYGSHDLRDLWDYELDLNDYQRTLLLRHTWELLGQNFTYFFTKQNCAYKMLELIEMVLDRPILKRNKLWMMPIDTFHQLAHYKNSDGKSILKPPRIIPSLQSKFLYQFANLTKDEKQIFRHLTENGLQFQKVESYLSSNDKTKSRVLNSLLDFFHYLQKKSKVEQKHGVERRKLLLEKAGLKVSTSIKRGFDFSPQDGTTKPLHTSEYPSIISFNSLSNSLYGHGGFIHLRLAYYDFLSEPIAHAPDSALSMFDFKFKSLDQRFYLSDLDLLLIDSLNVSQTNLKGDSDWSWNLRVGFAPYSYACINCPVAFIASGVGKSYRIGAFTLYSMVLGQIQDNVMGSGNFNLDWRMGIILLSRSKLTFHYDQRYRLYLKDMYDLSRFLGEFYANFRIRQNMNLRLAIKHNEKTETSLGLQFNW